MADQHRHEVIPEHPGEGGRLGRHIHFDERSRGFAVTGPAPDQDVLWKRRAQPFDQGNLGKCTIEGLVGCLFTKPFGLSRKLRSTCSTEAKRTSLYSEETATDPYPGQYPPDDTGSSVLAAMKLAVAKGLASGYQWALSASDAVTAIHKGPCEVGFSWYEGFDSPDGDGVVRVTGSVRGGHAFEIVGRINTTKLGWVWIAVNSWGLDWPSNPFMGKPGRFAIPDADFQRLRGEDGEMACPLPVA